MSAAYNILHACARYRVVDAVDRLNETEKGLMKIGVINKVSINLVGGVASDDVQKS